MPKVICVIQARMGSSRLPGKVLMNLEGKPVLLRVLDRVLRARTINHIIIATTDNPNDQKIIELVSGYHPKVSVFQGSEHDVLDRYYKAALAGKAEVVVRITSDCPLIDWGVLDKVVSRFLEAKNVSYISNVGKKRTYPRGLDVEVFGFKDLERAWREAKLPAEREHVTPYIRNHPEIFNALDVENDEDYSFHRWTLDEIDDFKLIEAIYKNLYPKKSDFVMADVLALFERNPDLIKINAHVEQKAAPSHVSGSNAGTLQKAIQGGKWMTVGVFFQKVFNFATFIILARLLLPADFGIIAVVLLVAGLFDALTTPGFERALTQRQGDVSKYLNVVWTFNLLKSFLAFILLYLAAPSLAEFFKIPDYVWTIRLGGILILITGLINIGQLFFFKELDFKKVFLRDAGSQIAYSLTALVWAFFNPTVLALLAGNIARYGVSAVMTYVLHPYRPKLAWQFGRLKDLFGYSKWVTLQNIFSYFNTILANSFVGHLLGPSDLGLFTKAQSIAITPISPVVYAVYKVSFSAYAKVQESPEKVREGIKKTLDIMFFISVPLLFLILFEAQRIVLILLGEKWLGMVEPLKIIALAVIIGALLTILYPLFEGLGRPDINFKNDLMKAIVSFIFFYGAVTYYGLCGAAFAMLGVSLVSATFFAYNFRSLVKIRFREYLPSLVTVTVATGSILALASPFHNVIKNANDVYFVLWFSALGLFYLGLIVFAGRVLNLGPYKTLKTLAKTVLPY